ncbi:MAG: hypothetical protein R2710_16770 [Acidimicrobiales bacterium]
MATFLPAPGRGLLDEGVHDLGELAATAGGDDHANQGSGGARRIPQEVVDDLTTNGRGQQVVAKGRAKVVVAIGGTGELGEFALDDFEVAVGLGDGQEGVGVTSG